MDISDIASVIRAHIEGIAEQYSSDSLTTAGLGDLVYGNFRGVSGLQQGYGEDMTNFDDNNQMPNPTIAR